MGANYFKKGEHNAICDRCGFKYKSSQLRKEWTGLMTCRKHCWERRNQQDLIKAVEDKQTVSWSRPETTDVFISLGDITADDL
jgi:hypothetical protein